MNKTGQKQYSDAYDCVNRIACNLSNLYCVKEVANGQAA